jgi:ribosomal protein L40E
MMVNSDDPEIKARGESEMKLINQAKDVLLNPELRIKYDMKIKKSNFEIEWSTDSDSEIDDKTFNENIEVNWRGEVIDEPTSIDLNSDYDPKSDGLDIDERKIIHNPPPQEENNTQDISHAYTPKKTSGPSAPDSIGLEVAPGVLFLQKCISCGKVNDDGTPYCRFCNNSLIYDNHPYFYNKGQTGNIQNGSLPLRPGSIPRSRQGVIVISVCFRCGTLNLKNRPICSTCKSNLIYYRRPLPNKLYGNNQDGRPSNTWMGKTFLCPRCGASNDVGRVYCFSCFAKLKEEDIYKSGSSPIPPGSAHGQSGSGGNNGFRNCPNCGMMNLIIREFCTRCNTRLIYDQPPISIKQDKVDTSAPVHDQRNQMVDCPHCGAENSIEDEICSSCYKNLSPKGVKNSNQIPVEDKTKNSPDGQVRYYGYRPCPKCKAENDIKAEFCRDCGYEFNNY